MGVETALALAPLSVLPSHQRRGIGLALMETGHDAARRLGYGYSIVLGHPRYYPKAGYVPAGLYGIRPPFDVPGEAFMALRLSSGAPAWTARYCMTGLLAWTLKNLRSQPLNTGSVRR